jgi:hypothetical protein
MMFTAVTIYIDREQEQNPFRVPENINGAPAKCGTFRSYLAAPFWKNTYSKALRDLIWECLYEIPAHRPTILELKARIRDSLKGALEAAEKLGEWPELWESFVPREEPPTFAQIREF